MPRPRTTSSDLIKARRRPPLHKRPLPVAIGSAALGFVTGAVFWHAVGFWTFVSDVVLRGPHDVPATVQEARASEPLPVAQRPTGSISPTRTTVAGKSSAAARAHLTCSIALPDAAIGEVHVLPCAPGTGPAPVKPLARKSDRLPVVAIAAEAAVVPARMLEPPVEPRTWTANVRGTAR